MNKSHILAVALSIILLSSSANADFALGYGTGINAATHSDSYNTVRVAMRTIDTSGLSGDQHDDDPDNMWYSGTLSNPPEGEPWVKYEFDTTYTMSRLWIWNFNQVLGGDDFGLRYGLNHTKIEYSIDDAVWTTLMDDSNDYFVLEKASGSSAYEPNSTNKLDLNGIIAKYIRISPTGGPGVGNFDTTEYLERYGLSEVRFYADSVWVDYRATDPTPGNLTVVTDPNITLEWTPGITAITQDLYFGTDPCSLTKIEDDLGSGVNSYALGYLDNDTYYWRIDTFDGSTEIEGALWGFEVAAKAANPSPENGFETGTEPIYLSWTPADGAVTQEVYFGTDVVPIEKVATGDTGMDFYCTGELDDQTTYYWRVDTITEDSQVRTGDVWSISTKYRLSYVPSVGGGLGIIAVDANVGSSGNPGYQAVNGSGVEINSDVHVSGAAENRWYYRYPPQDANAPITIHFDHGYKLNEMWIWNQTSNQALRKVKIEHSMNGVNWTTLTNPDPCSTSGDPNLFIFAKGESSGLPSNLENDCVVDFNGVRAKHVRLTAWGGIGEGNYETTTSYGYQLYELRFYCETPVLYCDKDENNKVDLIDYALIADEFGEDAYSETPSLAIDDFESYDPCDDPLVGGWKLAPWALRECPDGTALSISTDIAHSGSQSLKIEYDGSLADGLAYHSVLYNFGGGSTPNMDLSDYEYLEWWQYNAPGNDDVKYRTLWFGEWVTSDPYNEYGSIAPDIYWTNPKTWSEQVVKPAGEWFRMRISLSSISEDLINCDAFVIKCDTTEDGYTGTGTIYYDDVKFVSPHCEYEVAGDVTGDCRVDMSDIAVIAEEWLLEN